ncbi:hypothetical protein BHE74_00014321 [Ensete ventricosum]|nr:hypothetical protein BHE74_00014321 [Ensete ventricosum]RZR83452.1 hypothetical protein BHM03_00010056 [Ensete ventricosum]
MLQRANQYTIAKALVVGKREDHKRPRIGKPRGQPLEPLRRRLDWPKLSYPWPPSGTSSGQKAYAQVVVEKRPKQTDELKIAFEVGDAKYLDCDDTLVVLIRIANAHEKGHSRR